jgi:hypothetical protein
MDSYLGCRNVERYITSDPVPTYAIELKRVSFSWAEAEEEPANIANEQLLKPLPQALRDLNV